MTERLQERVARNEVLFREINERIAAAAADHGADGHVYEFLCECADEKCLERVALTVAEYERIRGDAKRFVVVQRHVVPEAERVVLHEAGHDVVEKHGTAGEIAESLDPRAA